MALPQLSYQTKIERIAYDLWALVQDGEPHESGDMRAQLHLTQPEFSAAMRFLRLFLADHGENVIWKRVEVTDAHGKTRKRIMYLLTADLDESSAWMRFTLRQSYTRIATGAAIFASFCKATDARTTRGRWARRIHRDLVRRLEDLTEFTEEFAGNSQP